MTTFHDVEALSVAGGQHNEDAFGASGNTLVAVDGATGLSGTRLTQFATDAQWFATRLASATIGNAHPEFPLPEILERSLAACAEDLLAMGASLETDLPSASVLIARCTATELEVLSLGDCTALVTLSDGRVVVLADEAVARLDGQVVTAAVDRAQRDGTSVRDALTHLRDRLRGNRALRNTDGGYWIADPTGAGLGHATLHRFPLDGTAEVALLTDGFAAVHTLTGKCADWAELAARLSRREGRVLLAELTAALEADPDFVRYPRLKHRDDATLIRGFITAPAGR